MIWALECTFRKDCVESILQNICPNCGGGFEKRPILPKAYLAKYSASDKVVFKPINKSTFQKALKKIKNIEPSER